MLMVCYVVVCCFGVTGGTTGPAYVPSQREKLNLGDYIEISCEVRGGNNGVKSCVMEWSKSCFNS